MPLKAIRHKAKQGGRYRRRAQEALARGEKAPEVDAGHGRPTKFKEEYVSIVAGLAKFGLGIVQMADVLGVSDRTFQDWRLVHREFDEAVNKWKGYADDLVERRLYERAVGYTYRTEKLFVINGEVQAVEALVHVPPSDNAAIYWLENRRPDMWRKARVETNAPADDPDRMSDAELLRKANLDSFEDLFPTTGRPH